MALPAGRYGVTKNQLLKIKKLPMNTIKLIEELTEKFDLLGTAAFKNSISVVTQSTDLVESGAVKDIVGWGNKNKNSSDSSHVFVKSTARTFAFHISIPIVNGHKYKFVVDVSAISGYIGTNALAVKLAKNGTDISGAYGIQTTAQGQQVIEMAATGSADSGAYVYCFILSSEDDNATITLSNVMVVDESVTDYSYEPHHESVEQTLRDAEVIEGKNLLENKLVNLSSRGITFTRNNNGTVSLSGTSESAVGALVNSYTGAYLKNLGNPLIINGGYGGNKCYVALATSDYSYAKVSYGSDVVIDTSELDDNTEYRATVAVAIANFDATGIVLYPMISKEGGAYEPYYTRLKDVVPNKCDNSVIGTVEDGTNPTKAYAVDEFMVRDGAFCQVTAPVTTSSTWTEGSNYTKKSIAEVLQSLMS